MPSVLILTRSERLQCLARALTQDQQLQVLVTATLAEAREMVAGQQPEWLIAEASGLPGCAAAEIAAALSHATGTMLLLATGDEAATLRYSARRLMLDSARSDAEVEAEIKAIISAPHLESPAQAGKAQHGRPALGIGRRPLLSACAAAAAAVLAGALLFGRLGPADRGPSPKAGSGNAVLPASPAPAPAPAPVPAPAAAPPQEKDQPAAAHPIAATSPAQAAQAAQAAEPAPGPTDPAAAAAPTRVIVVGAHDTVLKILKRDFGLSYHEALAALPVLRRLNKVADLDRLQPGQTLHVPVGALTGAPSPGPHPASGAE